MEDRKRWWCRWLWSECGIGVGIAIRVGVIKWSLFVYFFWLKNKKKFFLLKILFNFLFELSFN